MNITVTPLYTGNIRLKLASICLLLTGNCLQQNRKINKYFLDFGYKTVIVNLEYYYYHTLQTFVYKLRLNSDIMYIISPNIQKIS